MRTSLLLLISLAAGCAEHSDGRPAGATLDSLIAQPIKAMPIASGAPAAHAPTGPAPLAALTQLSAGNARFVSGRRSRSADASDDAQERATTAKGQHPFAAIVTCADSRVAPELVFDQSLGDLFVVRNAGNIAEPIGEGSLEYAVDHLGVRLIVVMGHASCGAVKAVSGSAEPLPGHLADIQQAMPGLRDFALERAKAGRSPDGVIADAVERNAIRQAAAVLANSPDLRKAFDAGEIAVVPAVYDLESGTVGFLPPTASSGGGSGSDAVEHPVTR